jgi:dTDP-4-dehydrorhamnose 3,5-epimerase
MEFIETSLRGAYVVRLNRIEDDRGYFARGWCREEFIQHKLNPEIKQLNIGFSHKSGTIRGMHYQLAPHDEAKFVRCTRGAIYDVIIDLRAGSPTLGRWYGVELTADNGAMVYAPEGCAHGYQTLKDETETYYMTSALYVPSAVRGVRYDDPAFGVKWPVAVSAISAADRDWPDYQFSANTPEKQQFHA